MSPTAEASRHPSAPPRGDARAMGDSVFRAGYELSKPKLTAMVLVAVGAGYLLADGTLHLGELIGALLGTGLVAASAHAFNQIWERDPDARMRRTQARPLPRGRVSPAVALALASGSLLLGALILESATNRLALGLALSSLLLYVFAYTPLKRRASVNTLVGAVPGAIPPLIGWAAATSRLDGGAWILFGILFVWQIPHFLAIAWLHREDYARGGFRMLPAVDPDGEATSRMALLYTMALVAVSFTAVLVGLGGLLTLIALPFLSFAFLRGAVYFRRERTEGTARRLFRTSLIYLPVLLGLMVLDRARILPPLFG